MSIYLRLPNRVKFHDWTSPEPRDLMERIDLMRELRELSMKDLAEILKEVKPEAAVIITTLVSGGKK